MSDGIDERAKELGYKEAGISGSSKRKFVHTVTGKTVFVSYNTMHGRAFQNALADLKRGAGIVREKPLNTAERRERHHHVKKPKPVSLTPPQDRETDKRQCAEETLKEQFARLFAEADKRRLSPEQAVAFAHAYIHTVYKQFTVKIEQVRIAYDAYHGRTGAGGLGQLREAVRGSTRGGWHRLA